MSVSSINANSYPYAPAAQSVNFQQRAQDFKALQTALQSGDLSSAQQAFSALQHDMPRLAQSANATSQTSPVSQLSQDFQSLQSALQSGDLSSAQQAFASLTQDLQSAHKGHHHRHPGQGNSTVSSTSSTTSTNANIAPLPSTPTLNQLA